MADPEDQTHENCCSGSENESGSGCTCGSKPKGRSRVKLLIFVIVILSAAGVGAYSLIARSSTAPAGAADCGTSCQTKCCPK